MSITPNDPANFTPGRGDYKDLSPFRFWCQKVLPLVYDDSLSYYELLCKVVDYLNNTMGDVTVLEGDVTGLHSAYVELQDYVNDYFSTLDVQTEIDQKLDNMATSGRLSQLVGPFVPAQVTAWLNDNIQPTTPIIDSSLTVEGAGADSKTVGDELDDIDTRLQDLEYEPIEITEFELRPVSTFERGTSLEWYEYEYWVSRTPASGTVTDGTNTYNATSTHGGGRVQGPFTDTITVTLTVEDAGSPNNAPHFAGETRTIKMIDLAHWGVGPGTVSDWNELLLTTLEGRGPATNLVIEKSIVLTAGEGEYIYYATPTAMGDPVFRVNGVEGGFQKVHTFNHVNASGGSTGYDVWRSDYPNLGRTEVILRGKR